MKNIILYLVLGLSGFAIHYIIAWQNSIKQYKILNPKKKKSKKYTLIHYIKNNIPQTAISLFSFFILFIIMIETGKIETIGTNNILYIAPLIGYAGNSIFRKIVKNFLGE